MNESQPTDPNAETVRRAERKSVTTLDKLNNYIASMAPHQKERMGGLLIIECKAEIIRLRVALERISRYVGDHNSRTTDTQAMMDIAREALEVKP